jgi:hypothetical protein
MQIAGDTPAATVFQAEHSERPKFAKASRLRQHACRPLARSPLIRSFPRSSVAAATLTVHLARSHGSIVEDFEAVLSQFATIAV